MSVNTFGVSVATVASRVHRLAITADTSPSSVDVDAWITQRAAELCGLLEQRGVGVASLTEATHPQIWHAAARWVSEAVVSDVILARERTQPEMQRVYEERVRDAWRRFSESVEALADGRPTAAGSANLVASHVTMAREVRAALESQSLAQRLANRGRL